MVLDPVRDSLSTMRIECTSLVIDGLSMSFFLTYLFVVNFCTEKVTKYKKVAMNYVNYDVAIVERYKIILKGWPPTVRFCNPSEIGTVDDIRTLRNALKNGECIWVAMSNREHKEHGEMLKQRQEAGDVVVKKRKIRSDKGKKRARDEVENESGPESDVAEPRKKKKTTESHSRLRSRMSRGSKTKLPPAPKRKAYAVSDDEDET
jgi:hypothetical protein